MLSKLTLIGLHNYTEGKLWENIELPLGIDKDILVNEILRQSGEFCVIYPDPDFLKIQITYWSKKWYHNFERWLAAYNKQYEALYNVDVKTVIEEHGINADSGNKSASDGRTASMTGNSSGNNGSLDTVSKAAYDASTFQNYEQTSLSGSTSLSSSESSSESASHSESESHSGSHDITTTEIKAGNQGITMSQELLLAEYNAWRFNLYSQIADIFASEFCITVYS